MSGALYVSYEIVVSRTALNELGDLVFFAFNQVLNGLAVVLIVRGTRELYLEDDETGVRLVKVYEKRVASTVGLSDR